MLYLCFYSILCKAFHVHASLSSPTKSIRLADPQSLSHSANLVHLSTLFTQTLISKIILYCFSYFGSFLSTFFLSPVRARLWSTHSPSHYIHILCMKRESLYKVKALHYIIQWLRGICRGLKESVWNGALWVGAPTESKLCSTVKLWASRGTWMKPFHSRSEVGRDVVRPCDGSDNGLTNNSFSTRTQSSPSSFSCAHSHAVPSGVPSRSRLPRMTITPRKENLKRVTVVFHFFSSRGSSTHSSTSVTEV